MERSNRLSLRLFVGIGSVFFYVILSAPVRGATPSVYAQPAYESPVRGDPDDLLLIPGYGLAATDTVVYEALADTTQPPVHPSSIPRTSTATLGVAELVSAADAPYSLTVHLPAAMTANQSYALWVQAPGGECGSPLLINDARPLWITPDSAYQTAQLANLPRVLKVVGRNLQPASGTTSVTQVRLVGKNAGTTYTLTARNTVNDPGNTTDALQRYVAAVSLPATLAVDDYTVQVSRDGASWVSLLGNGQSPAQTFVVKSDPVATPMLFSVGDPQFADPVTGTCQPDDGIDDTACIISAIRAATLAGGGTVVFGPGVWTMSNPGTWVPGVSYSNRLGTSRCVAPTETCGVSYYGVLVPVGVNLQGAGSTGTSPTTIERGTGWLNGGNALAGFTLQGNNVVSGIAFTDDINYASGFAGAPELQLGLSWYFARLYSQADPTTVSNITISNNLFVQPYFAISNAGLPADHVYITSNTFGGAYSTAIRLGEDTNDSLNLQSTRTPVYPYQPYRFNDSVIDYNTFYPSSFEQSAAAYAGGGSIATQINTSARLDFSNNVADGTATQYLYNPGTDHSGWRAAHFWSTGVNQEMMLVSSNVVTCPGDKYGDGEAISYDGSSVFGGMPDDQPVIASQPWIDPLGIPGTTLTVQGTVVTILVNSNGNVDISADPSPYYRSFWAQVVQGTGKGQWRKVESLSIGSNSAGPVVSLNVTPAFDVLPDATSTVVLGHVYWQNATVNNYVDQRTPTCTKANTRSGGNGGLLTWYASTADSAMEGNQQYDTNGILVRHVYTPPQSPVQPTDIVGIAQQSMNEVRGNLIDGVYNWSNPVGGQGGVQLGYGATAYYCAGHTCPAAAPPNLGFGVSIAHNTIFEADSKDADGSVHPPIGAIGLNPNWETGPLDEEGMDEWQVSDATLIFQNTLQNISSTVPGSSSSQPHVGIGIDIAQGTTLNPAISWRTTMYANTCSNVDVPVSDFGIGSVRYCPAGMAGTCECSAAANVDVGVSAASDSESGNADR